MQWVDSLVGTWGPFLCNMIFYYVFRYLIPFLCVAEHGVESLSSDFRFSLEMLFGPMTLPRNRCLNMCYKYLGCIGLILVHWAGLICGE